FRAKALLQFFRKCANEYRYGQVVQRLQGFRVHHPGRRRQGSLCPLLGDPGQRLQVPEGKPEGVVRCDRRPEGRSGRQHQAHRVTSRAGREKKPGQPGFFNGGSERGRVELARSERPFLDRTGALLYPAAPWTSEKRGGNRNSHWSSRGKRRRAGSATLRQPCRPRLRKAATQRRTKRRC